MCKVLNSFKYVNTLVVVLDQNLVKTMGFVQEEYGKQQLGMVPMVRVRR